MTTIQNFIVWDLGATKCAAGVVQYNQVTRDLTCKKQVSIKLKETSSLENLISHLESKLDFCMEEADAICIGAAGHYDGHTLSHANPYPYSMHFAEAANNLSWPAFDIVHDYVPIVCATFTSYLQKPENIKYLNQTTLNPYGRRVALGIGTGLGLKDGVLLADGDFWLGQNEIGHIGITTPPFADKTYQQQHKEFLHFLTSETLLKENEPLTFEKVLSGQGTVRLHRFFYPHDELQTPEEVGVKLRNNQAAEMLEALSWYTGLFIGTVQLTFMPEGGIWITGGVALNHLELFDSPAFFGGIHASPAYLSQRQQYPLGVLCNPEHALIGGGYYALKRLIKEL